MRVRDLMSRPVMSCRPEDSLDTAARLMWEGDIGALPVVEADERVVGMVTDRDICMSAFTQGKVLADIQVAHAMSQAIFSCRQSDAPQVAEKVMREHEVRRVPVVDDDGHLVGVLSMNDLVREVQREMSSKQKEIPVSEVVSTMAAICEPRRPAMAARA